MWHDDEFKAWANKGKWALTNVEGEWAPVPEFIVNTLQGWNVEKTRGPFVFKNGFDETDEAQYLISMMQYPELTDAAMRKVDSILTHYADWIGRDKEINNILRRHIRWL